jgi:hypothetical protein
MPEGENVHVAHELHEVSEKMKEEGRRHPVIVEIGEAFLLALVAIMTAWGGYQAAKWDGRSANYTAQANTHRVLATQAATLGGQNLNYDATTFNSWLEAHLVGNSSYANYLVRRFSPEYRVAFDAWLKTDPLHNPQAPPGPRYMPQYHNPLLDQADRLNALASATLERAVSAREVAEKYVRATVFLALVLFLVAMGQRFETVAVRAGLLAVGFALVLAGIGDIATYPIA